MQKLNVCLGAAETVRRQNLKPVLEENYPHSPLTGSESIHASLFSEKDLSTIDYRYKNDCNLTLQLMGTRQIPLKFHPQTHFAHAYAHFTHEHHKSISSCSLATGGFTCHYACMHRAVRVDTRVNFSSDYIHDFSGPSRSHSP